MMNRSDVALAKPYCVVNVDDLHAWSVFVTEQIKDRCKKVVVRKSEHCGQTWIYRGQRDASWDITSTLQREVKPVHDGIMSLEHDLRGKELAAIQSFKALAWKYVPNPNMTRLEWLMLMRHYGVPTRLVDFTESPMIALHFAIETEPCGSFAVWALNRDRLKDAYIESQMGKQLPEWDELTRQFGEQAMHEASDVNTNDTTAKGSREYLYNFISSDATSVMRNMFNRCLADEILNTPLYEKPETPDRIGAVWFAPELPSPRMVAQRGLFVMPLRLSESFMESVCRTLEINYTSVKEELHLGLTEIDHLKRIASHASIMKFVFKHEMINEVKDFLLMVNCSQLSLYPDIDGVAASVAKQIKDSLSGYEEDNLD